MINGKNKSIIIVSASGDYQIALDLHFELFVKFYLPSTIVSPDKYCYIENSFFDNANNGSLNFAIPPTDYSMWNPIISLGGPQVNFMTERFNYALSNVIYDDHEYQIRLGQRAASAWGKDTVEGTQKATQLFMMNNLENWLRGLGYQ
jgi:hypothetical protein